MKHSSSGALMACSSTLALAVVLGSGLAPAHAQVAGAAAPPTAAGASVGEVIVTARRRAENLQDVPVSVTAIGQQTLENLRVTNAEDLETLEPTLTVSPASGYPNRPVFSLRGIRPTEAIYGQDPTVAVYLAEVVQSPSAGSNLGFYDLESVQVLKGPQGTLFGRNTVGGAILLTPRRPGETFGGAIEVGLGSYGLVETELGLDIPISDRFRVRIAGQTINSEGYQTNVAPGPLQGDKLGGEDTRNLRLTGVWDVTPDIENTTIVSYDDRETNGRGTVLEAVNGSNAFIRCYDGPGNPNGTAGACRAETTPLPSIFDALQRSKNRDVNDIEADINAYDNVTAWSIINTTVAKLNEDLTLKSILSYREVETETAFDMDSTAIPGILGLRNQASDLTHYSAEVQLQGNSLGGRLEWLVGGYYYHEDGREYSPGSFFAELLPISPIEQDATVDNDSYSIFAQGSYDLTDQLTLTGGARMNWDKRQMTILSRSAGNCSLFVGTPPARLPNNRCAVDLEKSFSQPTGTVSLDYQFTPNVLFYATSRLGYRSGGFNLRADIPVEYEPFQPETVVDFELGAKTDWSVGDVRMRTNVALYNQWYDDIQRTVAVPNVGGSPGSAVVNAAKAEVFGLEFQQTIRPTDEITLQFNYTYIDPKYEEWIEDATGADLSDTPFFFTPKHAGNASFNYERPLPNDLGTFHFTANAAFTDEIWINALHTSVIIAQHPASVLPLLKQKSYWLLDMSAGWRDIRGTGLDVNAYVRNLTDEVYKVGGVQLYTGATGFISAAYGPPRTYGVQLRYKF